MTDALDLVILRNVIAVAVAFSGAVIATAVKRVRHAALCIMISIAAGALLAVALVDIMPESADLIGGPDLAHGWLYGIVAGAVGYVAFFLLGKFVSHICPACSATHAQDRLKQTGWLFIVAITTHATLDGVAIAASIAADQEELAFLVLVAVAYHKLPEGLALASVYRARGRSRAYALGLTLAIESSTIIGGAVAILLVESISSIWLGAILAFVGGGFVFVVLHALIGEIHEHERTSTFASAALGFVGIATLGAVLGWVGIGG